MVVTRAEAERLGRIEAKLNEIEEFERRQTGLLGDILDLFESWLDEKRKRRDAEERHRELTGSGRHLRLVREE